MLLNTETNRENSPVFRLAERVGDLSEFSFDWAKEINSSEAEVWRLSVASNDHSIGYISLSHNNNDGFVLINLIERENFNQKARFTNIGATLISYACLRSVKVGFNALVAFESKTKLIPWYQRTVNAKRIGNSNRMVILERDGFDLINRYLL